LIALVSATTSSFAQEHICAAPLSQALMTVRTSTSSVDSSSAATAWQCSFKFSSHDDAISAGLSVGTVVYGVPLKVGGSFDQSKTSQWKEENCSKSSQNESFEGATFKYLREVAPGAMNAFASCIKEHKNVDAVMCSLEGNPLAFTAKWRRTAGEENAAAPKVRRLMPVNGTCDPGLTPDTLIGDGGVGTPCVAEQGKDFMVMIETTRGVCTDNVAYEKKVVTLTSMVLESDRQITADVVQIVDGARIYTHGQTLNITADELRVGMDAQINGYEEAVDNRPPGTPGGAGGNVIMKVRAITGDELRIDLSGQNGAPGLPGVDGIRGKRGGDAKGRGLQGFKGCGGGHPSTPGGRGGAGTDGGPGGAGGNGGNILIQMTEGSDETSVSRLILVGMEGRTRAGIGGQGGKRGEGGPGGPGGAGGRGHDGCGGRPGSGPGPKGADGNPGPNGTDGKPGSIVIN
jgi:hypothetical protein